MKIQQTGSHLDQMIRQTRAHHVQLSSMADMKANIILTLSSLMLPLSVGYILDPKLHWSAVTIIFFCILTVIFAAYAVMPKMRLKQNLKKITDKENPPYNILFFGSFLSMEYSEYKQALEDVMNDHNKTYEVQIREIYSIGQYLAHKKYRFIRLAYISFITGVILSAVVYNLNYIL